MHDTLKVFVQLVNLFIDPVALRDSAHYRPRPTAPVLEMSNEISNTDTPDPYMIKYNGTYLLTFTAGNRVELWRSSLLHDFHDNVAAKRVIWYPTQRIREIAK